MHCFSNLFWYKTLHVSIRFTVHHQGSSTVYTAIGICHTGYETDCSVLISLADNQHNLYDKYLCCVYSTILLMTDSKPVRNMSRSIFFFYWRYNPLWVCILQPSSGAIDSSHTRLLDHTQRRATVGRTPLDECSVRRRDLYLTTHNTHKRQTSMPPVGFEPTIAAG